MKPTFTQREAAYRVANYKVLPRKGRPFVLRIGKKSVPLEKLYSQTGSKSAQFITACNPDGELAGEAENKKAQEILEKELIKRLGAGRVIQGIGEDPAGKWPGEESFLALGLNQADADRIARKYRQLAHVWAGEDAVPRLFDTKERR